MLPQVSVVVMAVNFEWLVVALLILIREDNIDSQLEGVVEHPGQVVLQELAGLLQARIRIYLNQPCMKTFVDHEIIAEYLKAVLPHVGVELRLRTFKCHLNNWFDLFLNDFVKVDSYVLLLFQNGRGLAEAQLVSFFKLAVVLVILLNCIIGQVHHWLID